MSAIHRWQSAGHDFASSLERCVRRRRWIHVNDGHRLPLWHWYPSFLRFDSECLVLYHVTTRELCTYTPRRNWFPVVYAEESFVKAALKAFLVSLARCIERGGNVSICASFPKCDLTRC